ncbi:MAG: hypothetical protein KJ970_16815 [Candidatus Eisenbacteria bacterium]|uniref:Uncharacterized protein n=1 Tax=Eiseniibacteriota bacterium TaxID=2212470 RepID=A0A948RZL9_UNCEI|nr:hypothetical protein [Candidatus Eisenbacteria bacterium]MBU1948105.1 hypothetical protein [Candidatus Eisenbacteria bacterium]MBU2692578.1 hypothetical protein [Candidatus Eisenbacteria bacterium]
MKSLHFRSIGHAFRFDSDGGFIDHLTEFIQIRPDKTVLDLLNEVYFMVSSEVLALTYLRDWMIRDASTGQNVVVYEVADRIPAHHVFSPGSKWEVIPLDSPYVPETPQSEPDS